MLVRDYIKKALYEGKSSYFASSTRKPIISNPITNFRLLKNESEWREAQQYIYDSGKNGGDWSTQVELYQPYFSKCIANFSIHEEQFIENGLNIIEIGGGLGTNAKAFLDHLQYHHPKIYQQCKYTLCEISPSLASIQQENVKSSSHERQCEVINKDFLTWDTVINKPTIIIALEVLDNLPHDKVRI